MTSCSAVANRENKIEQKIAGTNVANFFVISCIASKRTTQNKIQ